MAFAEHVDTLSEDEYHVKVQIEELQKIADKVGLNIFSEKTKIIATKNVLTNKIETSYGTIFRKGKFKYLGEWLQPKDQEKESLLKRKQKMELVVKLTRNIYNKKLITIHAKIRHYNTIVRPEVSYAAECLSLN